MNKQNSTIRIPFTGKLRKGISKLGIVILSLPKDLRQQGKMRFLDKLGMTSTKRNSKYQILNTKRRRLFPYIVLAILAVGIFTFLRTPQIAEAGWFDDTYGYRTPVLFENGGSEVTEERRVLLEIDTATLISAGKMQADCDDSRFVYNGTLVDFYIGTDACNDASTDYYVTLPSIAAGANTVWMYYGNDAATAYNTPWFEAGGAPTPVGAWQAIATADQSSSYTDLSGNGNDLSVGVAPTWDAADGWTFNGSTQYLDTGVVPTGQNYTYIMRFSNASHPAGDYYLLGAAIPNQGAYWYLRLEPTTGIPSCANGGGSSPIDSGTQMDEGVLAVAGLECYRDGVNLATITENSKANTYSTVIGATNENGTIKHYKAATVQAVAIYDQTLTADEIAAVTAAMQELGTTNPGTDDLVSWWDLDETSGSRADSHGSNTLTDNNTVTSTTGIQETAANFEKDNSEYLSTDASEIKDSITDTAGWAITGWANWDTVTDNTGILGNLTLTNSIQLTLRTNGAQFQWYDNASSLQGLATSGNAPPTDEWFFFAAWYDDTEDKVYARLNDTVSSGDDVSGKTFNASTGAFELGDRGPTSGSYLDGRLDEVAIFSRTLTNEELTYLYNSGNGRAYSEAAALPSLFSPTSTPATGAEEQSPQPVAYWKFDEGFGSTTQDHTSNDNDGSITGATWQTEDLCVSGKCLLFDGTDDYILRGQEDSLDWGANDGTIGAWIRTGADYGTSYGAIVINGAGGSGKKRFVLSVDGDDGGAITNRARFDIDDNTTLKFAADTQSINDNKWHYLVGVRDGNNLLLYVDGVQVASTDIAGYGDIDDTDGLTIGSSNNPSCGGTACQQFFNGSIDEVKVYPYARSAAQVKSDFISRGGTSGSSAVLGSAGNQSLSEGLIGYWKMDETTWSVDCSTEDVQDHSGNNNHGKACPDTTGPDGGDSGKFGGSNNFEVDDYVEFDDIAFGANEEWTASFWINSDEAVQSTIPLGKGTTSSYIRTFFNGASSSLGARNTSGDSETWVTVNMTNNTWYHITATANGNSGDVKMYLDGQFVGTSDPGANGSAITFDRFGRAYPNDSFVLDGEIDEVRIYNRALSPTEVRQLYNWAPGPVAHYKLDENTGTATVEDSSGNDNQGALSGSMTEADWVPGKYGSSLDFDGSDDYIIIANDDSLVGGLSAYTVSAWVQPENLATQDVFSTCTDSGCSGHIIGLELKSNGTIRHHSHSGTTTNIVDFESGTYASETWVHITIMYDGADADTYLNGVQVGTASGTGNTYASSTQPTTIGSLTYAGGSIRHFEGKIDELKFYNYARTQKQIIQDMNAGHPTGGSPIASQVGYWNFDEQQGQTVNDRGYGENNGTLGATSGSSTDDPTWKTGRDCLLNGCLYFDGDDHISFSSPSGIPINDDSYTISFWMNPDSWGTAGIIGWGDYGTSRGVNATRLGGSDYIRHYWWSDDMDVTTGNLASEWHHVAITYDGSNRTVYSDGNQIGTDSPGGIHVVPDADNLTLGVTNSTEHFTGYIDEIKVYTSALTQEEILIDYNLGSAVRYSSGELEEDDLIDGAGDAPIAEWKFDEGVNDSCSGGTNDTCDTSGNGNDGSISGATWKSAGDCKYGKCLSFDGDGDVITVSSHNLDVATWTFSTWFMWDGNSCDGSLCGLAYQLGGDTANRILLRNSDDKIQIQGNCCGTDLLSTTVFSPNQWYHIALTQTSGNLVLYVNGTEDATGSGTFDTGSDPIYIGAGYTNTYWWSGKMDQVKIYDYVLTQSQIAYDYNRGKPIAHWKLDDCTGTTAVDWSGNSHDGTIAIGGSGTNTSAGTCGSGTGTEAWNNGTTGKFNYSLDFDGMDDYIIINDSDALDIEDSITLSVWVKRDAIVNRDILIGKGAGTSTTTSYWLEINSSNAVAFYLNQGDTTDQLLTTTESVITDTSTWHHIVGTWDGTTQKVYLDGKQDPTTLTWSGSIGTGTEHLGIGRLGELAALWTDGKLDDARIYNYALSADQVKRLYNNDSGVYYGE